MKKYILASLLVFCFSFPGIATSADFVTVRIEAENYTSKSDRWVLTTPDFSPVAGPDPDPPHYASASGNANLELLPDTRVTHEDEFINGGPDGNFWGGPGNGAPRADYNVDIPEAGRYFVYVKTYSTNTEDNGIHVGVNSTLPESGQRIQTCSKNSWVWTSSQRTNENHCGVTKTIWLDFPEAGVNTITFYAREDGFEFDQFLLLKETHDGTLDCFPTSNDKIRCTDTATGVSTGDTDVLISRTIDGNTTSTPPTETEPAPRLVDLEIDINTSGSAFLVNDTIEYQISVSNNSQLETATNVLAKIDLPENIVFITSTDCNATASKVSCMLGNVSAGTSVKLSFSAKAVSAGSHRTDAQVTADEDDLDNTDDTASETINAQPSLANYEAGISISQDSNVSAIGDTNHYKATITNNGQQQIATATLRVVTGSGLSLQQCDHDCTVPPIEQGESTTLAFTTVATQSGRFNVSVELNVPDDANTENNFASLNETVISSGVAVSSNNLIVIEAETFSSSSMATTINAPHWFLVDEIFPPFPVQIDPDNTSYQDASNSAYVEALPDRRIDDNDDSITGVSNFPNGGSGATLAYKVFFTQAGSYNVYARVRANNSQDSSLHIGLNNDWPDTASAVAVCNPDGKWQWTNNLTGNTTCDTTSGASISVPTPGVHELMISQDSDGLELDKLILSLDVITDLSGAGPNASRLEEPSQLIDVTDSSGGGGFSLWFLLTTVLLLATRLSARFHILNKQEQLNTNY